MTFELREGIDLLLSRWSALQMAVQNERQEAQRQLIVDIYHLLIRPSEALYVDDLENLLDDFMFSLNTEIDDGSIEEIADTLMILRAECLQGNFALIERLRQPVPTLAFLKVVNGGEDDSGSIEMADNLTNLQTSQI